MPEGTSAEHRSAEAALNDAMRLHQSGDLMAADRHYTTALQSDPTNIQALRLQGILARETGDIEKSLALLTRAVEVAPDAAAPLNELALSQMVAGRLAEAENTLGQTLTLHADDATALTNLGALLQHRGHIQAAIQCYTTLLKQQPNDIDVRCNLAKALVDSGDSEAALQACDLAIRDSDQHPYTLATKGAVLTDLGNYAEARHLLEQSTEQMPDDDMALVNLALCLDELQQTEAAFNALQQSLDANPTNARAIADMANCLVKLNETDAATRLCEGFLSQHPDECLVLGSYALALAAAGETVRASALTDTARLVKTFDLNDTLTRDQVAHINAALNKRILDDPSLLMNPVSKATSGGAQTGELNLQSAPEFAEIESFFSSCIQATVTDYMAELDRAHPVLHSMTDHWSLRGWGTVLESGGRQTAHMHPLGWLSGVYYVQVPEQGGENNPHAGSLLFGPAPERFSQKDIERVYHQPEAGQLVLFPSWFWHQTVPFQSADKRVSLAFDVMPQNALRML